jgi:hypothetical protein
MKRLVLAVFIVVALGKAAVAQQTFSTTEFNKNLGKTGTLCDTVYSLKIVSDTLTLLNMGGAYPNQKYTIAVIGNQITLDWTNIKGKHLCVTGVFELYKGRPEIEIADPKRINMQ